MSNVAQLAFEDSFASHPKHRFWSDKNELKPENVSKNSRNSFWFFCDSCIHIFLRPLNKIYEDKEHCSYCVKPSKLLCTDDCMSCYDKSFASHPKSKLWSDKNGDIRPREVLKSSGKKYWFKCAKCNHDFDCSPANIQKRDCPFCSSPPKKLCTKDDCTLCYGKSFASHPESKSWSDKNGDIRPRDVFRSSGEKRWLKCDTCNHDFEIGLDNITCQARPRWCPYCCIPTKMLCDINECGWCHEKSFASHPNSIYWSNKNIDAEGKFIRPRSIPKCSNKVFIFDCTCGHEIEKPLNDINTGSWCPYCCNPRQKLCENDECKNCFDNSFASHAKSVYWSYKNIDADGKFISPRQVSKKTDTFKCILFCDKCNHEFERLPYNVQDDSTMIHCIYCVVPTKMLCNTNECKFCFERSFASHDKSAFYSNENELSARQLIKGSNNKVKFKCAKGHDFIAALSHITNGTWCPYCVNKTETKLYDQLLPHFNNLKHQFKVEWCKNKKYLPFDFVLEEFKIIIELDGAQHFVQVSSWSTPEEQFTNDKYKETRANDNGYSTIRILQADVYYDTYDWLSELRGNINKILNENNVQNIYMCKNNEYNAYK